MPMTGEQLAAMHRLLAEYYRRLAKEAVLDVVQSMTAPIASGWSGCRVGLAPTGKRRLCTAHAKTRSRGTW
jgi:hypothetical protein